MPRLSKEDWVRAASRALAQTGVAAVRVEALARDLGVSKGSFYWHFKDRAALRGAVVDTWAARATEDIITEVDGLGDNPADRLWALMERVFGAPLEYDRFEGALRAWGAQVADIRRVILRVDARRIGYIEGILIEAGVEAGEAARRSKILYSALVGEFTMRTAGDPPLDEATVRSLHALMLVADDAG